MYQAPIYTEQDIENETISFPFSTDKAVYLGRYHQYELTRKYFEERGVNLEERLEGDSPDKINNFLTRLRIKFYSYIYTHCKSTRDQINYLIAKRGLRGFDMLEYRDTFLEAMFIEGEYLIDNGDISSISGVDLDIMQNVSIDVIRNQDRDMSPTAINMLLTLGLNFYGSYRWLPQGKGKEW